MVIHISSDISKWEGTPADIELERGDKLLIPKKPDFVAVSGQVYNPSAFTFLPGKSLKWYLSQAGGTTQMANKKDILIVRADGSVLSAHQGNAWFRSDFLDTKLHAGETVVVPSKILGGSVFWRNLATAVQLSSGLAIAASVLSGF